MVKDTTKATQTRSANTHKKLEEKVKERDEKLKDYQGKLETYIKAKTVSENKEELRKFNTDIKKLERQIQKNINDNYPKKSKVYDELFEKMGGRPKSFLVGTKFQYAKSLDELDQTRQPNDFRFPKIKTVEEPQPTGEPEIKDSKSGFGRKGGKSEPLQETKASMRGSKKEPKEEKEEMEVGGSGSVTETQKEDLSKAKNMKEFEITRIKELLSYMEQFKPIEHAEMVANRDQFIADHPEYMDLSQEDRDRLSLYYTERAFNLFDLPTRKGIEENFDSDLKKKYEPPDLDTQSEREQPPSMRGGRRNPATAEEPQKEGDEPKLKSSDANNKANAEPGTANSGAETNQQDSESQPTTAPTTTTTTEQPTTTTQTTDPDTATKFEGREGEIETTLGGGGVGGFKNDVLSQLEPQSEIASKLAEDKMRRRKDVERLIKEIECFHLVYDAMIPMFRNKDHNKAKDDAIQSKDRDKLVKHHQMMSDAIRKYYKTADLRVGVIMSAESMFGQSVSNMITNHMASGGTALPNAIGGAKFIPKGSDPVKNAVAGNVNIRRGGANTRRVPQRLVPKIGVTADATKIPEFTPVVDAPMPYVFQTGVRARRQFRDPNLKLKSKK